MNAIIQLSKWVNQAIANAVYRSNTAYTRKISAKSISDRNQRNIRLDNARKCLLNTFERSKAALQTIAVTAIGTLAIGYLLAVQPVLDENENIRHAAQIAASDAKRINMANEALIKHYAEPSTTLTITARPNDWRAMQALSLAVQTLGAEK